MTTIKIGEKEYQIEFTFEAAECKGLVQSMFNVLSGSYVVKNTISNSSNEEDSKATAVAAMVDGVSEMVADIPRICRIAFFAGMLENNPVSEDEAKELMKQYMKENRMSFYQLFEDLKKYMEEDGFFDLSGITEMIQKMDSATEENQTAKTENKQISTK